MLVVNLKVDKHCPKMPKMVNLERFGKLEVCGQAVLPDRPIKKLTKVVGKCQKMVSLERN